MSHPSPRQSGRLLVIEDRKERADVYVTALLAANYDVELAETARGGMRMVRDLRPDLVVVAHELPDAPGLAVLKAIRADAGLADIPVIVLTDSNRVADVLSAVSAGADDCVRQPCEAAALVSKVGLLLRRPRPRTAAR